jgi:hypothetical protein
MQLTRHDTAELKLMRQSLETKEGAIQRVLRKDKVERILRHKTTSTQKTQKTVDNPKSKM